MMCRLSFFNIDRLVKFFSPPQIVSPVLVGCTIALHIKRLDFMYDRFSNIQRMSGYGLMLKKGSPIPLG